MTPPADAELRSTGAAVICAGVVHIYPGEDAPIVALRNLDLEVRAGEMLAILGPSGSGKSTLLSVLSGIVRPTGGKVLVAGHDVARLDARGLSRIRATELALLLQNPLQNLLPYASVLENLAFAQRGARRRRWGLRWSPGELVDAFGLGPLAGRPVHLLSGGEQQKVATASAVATSPRVVLADEPTTQLDAAGRDAVIAALRQAHELTGATVIVVTHDAATAEAFPRTLAISHGAIGSEGRGGRRFAVIGRDGSVHLPVEVAAQFPVGTLFEVSVADGLVQLRPEEELEKGPAQEGPGQGLEQGPGQGVEQGPEGEGPVSAP